MKKINVQIGWSGKNFSALLKDDMNGMVIATHKTLEGVKKEIESAFDFHIEGLLEDGDKVPDFIQKNNFEFNFELLASALLKVLDGTLTRSTLARITNINQRQLGHYIQGKREARKQTRDRIIIGVKELGNELLNVV